ncbi:hypothetical protein [Vibrio owensii]|uniref:hypothetical protein n=1 Tax=Vibrio harveyi group TaxID=717610 RepID=UPI003CC526B0
MSLNQIIINHLIVDVSESAEALANEKCNSELVSDCIKEAVVTAVSQLENIDIEGVIARAKHIKNIDVDLLNQTGSLEEIKSNLVDAFESATYDNANQGNKSEESGWSECLYLVLSQLSYSQFSNAKREISNKHWFNG